MGDGVVDVWGGWGGMGRGGLVCILSDPRALMFLPEGLETERMDTNRFYDGKKTWNPFFYEKDILDTKKKKK
ncbi:hypothetical protein BDZ91DRAFT_726893 [Kalaharituber pfeilii]|nr:hypothetical protein BDZ91DRAFT_726893 [Kalaharituber pfeilii]